MNYWARTLVASLMIAAPFTLSASAQTFSDAFAGFGSNDKEPIEIEAKDLQVQDKQKTATFSGDVIVKQGESQLKANKLIVYYSGSMAGEGQSAVQQSISRLEAFGGVLISSKDQVATGDSANFNMDSQIMTLTGKKVTLSQGQNIVVGKKLIVNLKTGKVDLDAEKNKKVRLLLQPKSLEKQ